MTTAWVVYGEWGAYSDYSMWFVRVFATEAEARAFVKLLEQTPVVGDEHPLDPQFMSTRWAAAESTKWDVAEVPLGYVDGEEQGE